MPFGAFAASLVAPLREVGWPFILGFLLAGIVHTVFLRWDLARLFRGSAPVAVLKGVLFGAPLPICCCGVVPIAIALRRRGVVRPALMSFLISTPETGVSSLLITFALIGPLFTWVRPATAVLTAIVAGLLIALLDRRWGEEQSGEPIEEATAAKPPDATEAPGAAIAGTGRQAPVLRALRRLGGVAGECLRNGFVSILDDVAFWLTVGLIISVLVTALMPADYLVGLPPWTAMLLAVLAGLPLYMCAVSSTPLAMALLAKGLNPGAALVFLLVGPATNVGTIGLVHKFFGRRFTMAYLGAIVVIALGAGATLNAFVPTLTVRAATAPSALASTPWLDWGGTLVFAGLLVASLRRTGLRVGWRELSEQADLVTLGVSTRLGRLTHATASAAWRWVAHEPRRRLAMVGGACVAMGALASCVFAVPAGYTGFVLRFGRIVGNARGQGWHLKLPWPIERHRVVPSARILKLNVGFHASSSDAAEPSPPSGTLETSHEDSLALTADEILVELPFSVRLRVRDPRRFYFAYADPEPAVLALAEEAVRTATRSFTFDQIVGDKREQFVSLCNEALAHAYEEDDLGVESLGLSLVDVHPPIGAAGAFREVSDAMEEKATVLEQAETARQTTVATARGEKAIALARARQRAAETLADARGRANAFVALQVAYRVSRDVTLLRLRLEAASRALAGPAKWILPTETEGPDLWFGIAPSPSAEAPPQAPKR